MSSEPLAMVTTRRAVVKTGVKLAYAAPLVAATMKLSVRAAGAVSGPGAPSVCKSGIDYTSGQEEPLYPWVVCRADASTAWVSGTVPFDPRLHRGYHPKLICQSLGYASFDKYGGTCGNVCGYCEGTTSCQNPGQEIYDGGGLLSTDDDGGVIGATVHWRCIA